MPKRLMKIESNNESQMEKIEIMNLFEISENNIQNLFVNTKNDLNINVNIDDNKNDSFAYYTPIAKEKKSIYISSNLKKRKRAIRDDGIVIKGKNLLYIFESM